MQKGKGAIRRQEWHWEIKFRANASCPDRRVLVKQQQHGISGKVPRDFGENIQDSVCVLLESQSPHWTRKTKFLIMSSYVLRSLQVTISGHKNVYKSWFLPSGNNSLMDRRVQK